MNLFIIGLNINNKKSELKIESEIKYKIRNSDKDDINNFDLLNTLSTSFINLYFNQY